MNAASPPQLNGYRFIEKIGAGGFADVFLYEQEFPTRRVAVKVLRAETDAAGQRQFQAEANVMAQLSSHPAIVPIYGADVAPDGRAYLVMEYCPPPHLAQRYRKERIQLAQVLDIGVRIASAVETAHRAGILHRDIKPHNILTSAYGAPLLTDFGIATAAGGGANQSQGLSVPWSPAEAFQEEAPLDVRSDVYSLAATIYSLLAGRSPFEVPGAANDTATLVHRIENQEPSRIIRADVPDSLNSLLARGLTRVMDRRTPSAMALARELQEIQIELELPPTRLEVMDASPDASAVEQVEDDRTEIRPIAIIVPDQVAQQGTLLRSQLMSRLDERTDVKNRVRQPSPETIHKRPERPVRDPELTPLDLPIPSNGSEDVDETEGEGRRPTVFIGGGLLAVVICVLIAVALHGGGGGEPDEAGPSTTKPSLGNVISSAPQQPTDLRVKRQGDTAVLTWTNPDPKAGDTYRVRSGGSMQALDRTDEVDEPTLETSVPSSGVVCASVVITRGGISSAHPLEDCVVLR